MDGRGARAGGGGGCEERAAGREDCPAVRGGSRGGADLLEDDKEDINSISLSSRAEERRALEASPKRAVVEENGGRRAAQVWVRRGTLAVSQPRRKASLRKTMVDISAPAVNSVE